MRVEAIDAEVATFPPDELFQVDVRPEVEDAVVKHPALDPVGDDAEPVGGVGEVKDDSAIRERRAQPAPIARRVFAFPHRLNLRCQRGHRIARAQRCAGEREEDESGDEFHAQRVSRLNGV